MRVRWRKLELPNRVTVDRDTLSGTYGKFVAEPFEHGYGHTIGNSLRRVLLSSLEGAAITGVKIKNVQHEFSTIKGVYEEVPEIILNLKEVLLKMEDDEPRTLTLKRSGKGEIRAKDIELQGDMSILNPDMVICTLTDDVEFEATLNVKRGRGYVTSEENSPKEAEVALIPMDSTFTPVTRVRYTVEEARVGKDINYDRLILEIWTDGTVNPEMALVEASKVLRKHLNPFVQYFELGQELQQKEAVKDEDTDKERHRDELRKKLGMPISELDLSVRAQNCVESEQIKVISDLVRYTETEMLKMRNFGKTSLKEIKKKLSDIGLSLGMNVDELVGQSLGEN